MPHPHRVQHSSQRDRQRPNPRRPSPVVALMPDVAADRMRQRPVAQLAMLLHALGPPVLCQQHAGHVLAKHPVPAAGQRACEMVMHFQVKRHPKAWHMTPGGILKGGRAGCAAQSCPSTAGHDPEVPFSLLSPPSSAPPSLASSQSTALRRVSDHLRESNMPASTADSAGHVSAKPAAWMMCARA